MTASEAVLDNELEESLKFIQERKAPTVLSVGLRRDEIYYIYHLLRERKKDLSVAVHRSGIYEHESTEYRVNTRLRVKLEQLAKAHFQVYAEEIL